MHLSTRGRSSITHSSMPHSPQAVGAACNHAAFGELLELLQGSLEEDVQSNRNTFLNKWALGRGKHGGNCMELVGERMVLPTLLIL